jgi:hypothetical protein
MKRLLPVLLMSCVATAGKPVFAVSDGRLYGVIPPKGLVDRAVVIDQGGTIQVSGVQPPSGLVNRPVVIDQNGTLSVSSVTPPANLADREVVIDASGEIHLTTVIFSALGTIGAAALVLLFALLGFAVLARHRRFNVA